MIATLKKRDSAVNADPITGVFFESINDGRYGDAKNFEIAMSDGFCVSYNYMEREYRRIDLKPKSGEDEIIAALINDYHDLYISEPTATYARSSLKIVMPSNTTALRQMERAFRANFTHSVDALIARRIVTQLGSPVLSIHDCIGVDVRGLDLLVHACRDAYSSISFRCGPNSYTMNSEACGSFIMS